MNKARRILEIIKYMEDYANTNIGKSDSDFLYRYIIKLAEDLKRKKISKLTKKFIENHPFFDDSVA